MRTEVEFIEFYRMTLLPKLKELESKRKHISRIMIFSAVLLFVPAISSFLLIKSLKTHGGIVIIAIFVAIVILGLIGRFSSKTYIKDYKRLIIENIVAFVDKNLIYHKKKYVSKELFNESQLFTKKADGFYGDDYITGRIEGVEVEFSEVHAEYLRSKTIYNIFNGMFMVIHLGIPFKGLTVVVPDVAERILGKIVGKIQELNFKREGKLIKFYDDTFEKSFVIYSTDEMEARAILSIERLKKMIYFRKELGKNICFSFVNSRVYVGVSYFKQLFEAKYFRNINSFENIKEVYLIIFYMLEIAKELVKNTEGRIDF